MRPDLDVLGQIKGHGVLHKTIEEQLLTPILH